MKNRIKNHYRKRLRIVRNNMTNNIFLIGKYGEEIFDRLEAEEEEILERLKKEGKE